MANKPVLQTAENDFTAGKTEKPGGNIKYSLEELMKAAKLLYGVPPECVKAAFSVVGKTEATEEEARRTVKNFMIKEVK